MLCALCLGLQIRPDSNCPRFVRGGGQNMFPYFREYLLCVEAYHNIYSGIMAQFLYLKIGPKIDCVVYILMYVMIKANIVQFCGPVELIVDGWIW